MSSGRPDHRRFDELVRHAVGIARLDCGDGVRGGPAFAESDHVDRAIRPFPALIAVHRVVAAADGRDPVGWKLGEVPDSSMRRHVAAVGERMDPRPLLHALTFRQLQQRAQVIDVRVDAAVGDEADEVHVATARRGTVKCPEEGVVLEERAVLDRLAHAHEILEEQAARADREVADLRVAHLAVGKADRRARRGECRVWIPLPESVEHRRLGELDRVAGPRGRDPPPVEDDERAERDGHAGGRAAGSTPARQIASKSSASSDAPPTSAPSTSGCASSSAALSGFTEPP